MAQQKGTDLRSLRDQVLRADLPALLLFSLVGVTVFSIVRPGNILGSDEWMLLWRANERYIGVYDRPFAEILLWLLEPFLGANILGYHIASVALWISTAFLLYLFVRLLAPTRPLFAVAGGLLILLYFQYDFFMLVSLLQTSDVMTSVVLMLSALVAHVAYMRASIIPKGFRIGLLLSSLIFVLLVPLVREASIPILLGVPALIYIISDRVYKSRWPALVLWYVVILIPLVYIARPFLGISPATYGSNVLSEDLSVRSIIEATQFQFSFAADPLNDIGRSRIFPVLWPVIISSVLIFIGFLYFTWRFDGYQVNAPWKDRLQQHTIWIAVSLVSVWLGFSAFLLTVYSQVGWRTHSAAKPAEAVLLASLIWLASDMIPLKQKWLIQYTGVMIIALSGMGTLGNLQQSIDSWGGTWTDSARFIRSLSESVPAVKPSTLFVYMQEPDPFEGPFTIGIGFQYAMRYFYEDQATGVIQIDVIHHSWEATPEGFYLIEEVESEPHLYTWDEVIFVERRSSDGRAHIMERIPDEYYTPEAQAQYDPYARIVDGPPSPRVKEAFPDWVYEEERHLFNR